MVIESLLETSDTLIDEFFAIKLLALLIESSNILHSCKLEEEKAY